MERKEYYINVVELSKKEDKRESVVLSHSGDDYRELGKTTIFLADTNSIQDIVGGGIE